MLIEIFSGTNSCVKQITATCAGRKSKGVTAQTKTYGGSLIRSSLKGGASVFQPLSETFFLAAISLKFPTPHSPLPLIGQTTGGLQGS